MNEVVNQHRLEVADELVDPGFKHSRRGFAAVAAIAGRSPNESHGVEGIKGALTMMRTAFPDRQNSCTW